MAHICGWVNSLNWLSLIYFCSLYSSLTAWCLLLYSWSNKSKSREVPRIGHIARGKEAAARTTNKNHEYNMAQHEGGGSSLRCCTWAVILELQDQIWIPLTIVSDEPSFFFCSEKQKKKWLRGLMSFVEYRFLYNIERRVVLFIAWLLFSWHFTKTKTSFWSFGYVMLLPV